MKNLLHIKSISSGILKGFGAWSKDGLNADLVELADGRILCINDEIIILYKDMDDFTAGDPWAKRPHILL